MIYRDEKRKLTGMLNRVREVTTDRHIIAYAEGGLPQASAWLASMGRKWGQENSRTEGANKTWDLNAGYDGATRMAKDGWSEGAQDLDARLQAIMPSSGREARWGYSVAGSSPNVGRYLRGNPSNMRTRRKRQSGSAPVYHLVINGGASCAITAEQMKNYGTAMVGLIDRLENTGKRVMLDVMFCGALQGDKTRYAVGWNVKKSNEPVDLAAVAFSIAHPAAFRRIGFAMMERLPSETDTWGYGYVSDILEADVPDFTNGMMLIDGVNHEPGRCNSPQDALRMAVEQINKAAVLAGHATVDEPLIDDIDLF